MMVVVRRIAESPGRGLLREEEAEPVTGDPVIGPAEKRQTAEERRGLLKLVALASGWQRGGEALRDPRPGSASTAETPRLVAGGSGQGFCGGHWWGVRPPP